MTPLPITALILTFNEQRNLVACLASLAGRIREIVVIDSGSSDDTISIAERYGARVYQHQWRNYAAQFQWALENVEISTEWVLRVDADERWSDDGFERLRQELDVPGIHGINVRMRIYFMGRWMKHGGLYPNQFLRVFRREGARIEQRWMDEHLIVQGRVSSPKIDVDEANYDRQENIGLWTRKHNDYATREAIDILVARHGRRAVDSVASLTGNGTERKRWMKEHVYNRLPPYLRAIGYFVYRYLFRLGFLDGEPGFVFHVLQGFWYRFLVDVKVRQMEKAMKRTGQSLEVVVRDAYGIQL